MTPIQLPKAPNQRWSFIIKQSDWITKQLIDGGYWPFVEMRNGCAVFDPYYVAAHFLYSSKLQFQRESQTFLGLENNGYYVEMTNADLYSDMVQFWRALPPSAFGSLDPDIEPSALKVVQILKQMVGAE